METVQMVGGGCVKGGSVVDCEYVKGRDGGGTVYEDNISAREHLLVTSDL